MLPDSFALSLAQLAPFGGAFDWLAPSFGFVAGAGLCLLVAASAHNERPLMVRAALGLIAIAGMTLLQFAIPTTSEFTPWVQFAAIFGYLCVLTFLTLATGRRVRNRHRHRLAMMQREAWQRPPLRVRLRSSLLGHPKLIRSKLDELGGNPLDPRLRKELVDLYVDAVDYDSAAYHAYALIELLPHGPSHALSLYRLCQILVDHLNRLDAAQPHLRKIIRLYPRSFFASYARRLVNQYDAYADY